MAAIKVKLVRSMSGRVPKHLDTLRGLGLSRMNQTRILPDNAAIRGMVGQVAYMLEWSTTDEAFKPFGRPHGK